MLVNNPCVSDARVIREAETLAAAGHHVTVLGTSALGLPDSEMINGVLYSRFSMSYRRQEENNVIDNKISVKQVRPMNSKFGLQPAGRSINLESASNHFINLTKILDRFGLKFFSVIWYKPASIVDLAKQQCSQKIILQKLYKITPSVFLDSYRQNGLFINSARFIVRQVAGALRSARKNAQKARRAIIRATVTPTLMELHRHHYIFGREIVRLNPDVIHAHDLYTLWAGALGARNTGAKLIYDSHELEMGRNGNYTHWHRYLRSLSERILVKRADAVITVCDSIADHLAVHYRITRPTVIVNAPEERWLEAGDTLRNRLDLGADVPLCVSVGKTAMNRGLEFAVQALAFYPEAHLALVGPRDERVAERIRAIAAEINVIDRVHFVDPVPHYNVVTFVASADVSLILVQNICLSYYMCFPNKLLESLLAGLPVVASRLIELERVIGETGAGIITDETNPKYIAQSMREVAMNRDRYVPNPKTLDFIRMKYGWPTQQGRLLHLYSSICSQKHVTHGPLRGGN